MMELTKNPFAPHARASLPLPIFMEDCRVTWNQNMMRYEGVYLKVPIGHPDRQRTIKPRFFCSREKCKCAVKLASAEEKSDRLTEEHRQCWLEHIWVKQSLVEAVTAMRDNGQWGPLRWRDGAAAARS